MNKVWDFKLLLILFVTTLFNACVKPAAKVPVKNGDSNLKATTLLNIPYGTNIRQVFDIHLPAKRDSNTPVIVMLHGGAWKAGQKEDLNTFVNLIKAKWENVALINLNYRLASNANNIHHTQIIADINEVVTLVKIRATNYQISNKIGIMGVSAGGQLAMIYAYKYNKNIKCVGNIFGPSIINDWNWYNSTNVFLGGYTGDVLAEYVGKTWDTTAYKAVSPYWNVNATTQPTIIFHGNLDPIVPVYQSKWLNTKLTSLGVTNQYHEYVAFHSFDNTQSIDVVNKLVAFFKPYL